MSDEITMEFGSVCVGGVLARSFYRKGSRILRRHLLVAKLHYKAKKRGWRE